MPDFKQRADSLAAADAALQLALEGSGVGFWYHDIASGRAWQSAGFRALLGYAAEAADVDPGTEVHPEDERLISTAMQHIASGAITQFEHEIRMLHRDGQYRWMLSRGRVAQRDANGNATRLVGMSVDITQRKLAEEARDASYQILRTVIESLPHIVFWKDRHGVYQGCNQAFASALQLASPADVIGRTDVELPWSEELRRNILATDALILSGEHTLRNELRDTLLDGRVHPALVSSVPLRDAGGSITGFVGLVIDIADMSQAQTALRHSEERWNLALNTTGTSVWEFDYATHALFRSSFLPQLLGYEPGELELNDASSIELAHPDDRAEFERFARLIAAGKLETLNQELRLRRKDGSYMWFLARGALLGRAADGRPLRFIGTHTDITQRKQAEIAAESSRELLRNIIDAIPHDIFWKNEQGVYLGCNLAFVRSAGCASPQEIIGRTDRELNWLPERVAAIQDVDRAVLRGERDVVNQPFDVAGADGTLHRLVSVLPFHHAPSHFSGLIGIVIDITEQQRARAAAQLNERRWELALESSGAGVWEIDTPSGKIYRSPRLCAMLGYGPDEMDSSIEAIHNLVHPDDLAIAQAVRSQVASGASDIIELQHRVRTAAGTYRWILSRGAVITRAASGLPVRTVGTFTDITEEYEDRDRNAQARKLESLGNLAAGVAHEINTPLQFVSDSVSFLQSGCHDIVQLAAGSADADIAHLRETMPRALQLVQEGITRIAEIVRAMRIYSHPDSRIKEPADVDALLRGALAMARHEYRHVADIRADLSGPPLLLCHPGELSQVFVNLIVNAAHAITVANPDGMPRGLITVRSALVDGAIQVEIEDTGCGIPPAQLDRIFEPFFTTKPLGQGTGQGLAIARNVVEQHHDGRMAVRSQPGRGTVMRIVLPLKTAGAQAVA
jgi:two-component system NtrC family sensor kinase